MTEIDSGKLWSSFAKCLVYSPIPASGPLFASIRDLSTTIVSECGKKSNFQKSNETLEKMLVAMLPILHEHCFNMVSGYALTVNQALEKGEESISQDDLRGIAILLSSLLKNANVKGGLSSAVCFSRVLADKWSSVNHSDSFEVAAFFFLLAAFFSNGGIHGKSERLIPHGVREGEVIVRKAVALSNPELVVEWVQWSGDASK
jgi:hypothetical protein